MNAFAERADLALDAMADEAVAMEFQGVAVVAIAGGERVESWQSAMRVGWQFPAPAFGWLDDEPDRGRPFQARGDGEHASGQRRGCAPSDERGIRLSRRRNRAKRLGLLAAFSGGPGEDDHRAAGSGVNLDFDLIGVHAVNRC